MLCMHLAHSRVARSLPITLMQPREFGLKAHVPLYDSFLYKKSIKQAKMTFEHGQGKINKENLAVKQCWVNATAELVFVLPACV